jgi:hypothetical protein
MTEKLAALRRDALRYEDKMLSTQAKLGRVGLFGKVSSGICAAKELK